MNISHLSSDCVDMCVSDRYMSLIHTCELNGINPFDYLAAVLRRADQAAAAPAMWMPWNYRANLANLAAA